MSARSDPVEYERSSWKRAEADIQEIEHQNATLVSHVIEDPERGFTLLYDRYAREVNRLVYRLLGYDADHDDFVQQVFLQLIQSIAKLRAPERLNFWVRSITVNVVRSELRKRSVRRAFLRWAPRDEDTGDLSNDVEVSEFMSVSNLVLERLPAQERIVFLLYYLEERSLPEIAELCGFSTMTAKRRLASARDKFRKHMKRRNGEKGDRDPAEFPFISGGTP
jgi:RNA polymerase sigma factor (sigma-70 family)